MLCFDQISKTIQFNALYRNIIFWSVISLFEDVDFIRTLTPYLFTSLPHLTDIVSGEYLSDLSKVATNSLLSLPFRPSSAYQTIKRDLQLRKKSRRQRQGEKTSRPKSSNGQRFPCPALPSLLLLGEAGQWPQ